jgi:hypothetical protein
MGVQKIAFVLGTVIAGAAVSPVFADDRGTMEQQMACTPDVWRLCSAFVPDRDNIIACLRQNTPQLSGACRAVFEPNGSAPGRDLRRARATRPPAAVPHAYYPAQPGPYSTQPPAYEPDDE